MISPRSRLLLLEVAQLVGLSSRELRSVPAAVRLRRRRALSYRRISRSVSNSTNFLKKPMPWDKKRITLMDQPRVKHIESRSELR